jgi:hypothetical protein
MNALPFAALPTVLIVKAGFIRPPVSAAGFGAVDKYSPADLDDFLARLLVNAAPSGRPQPTRSASRPQPSAPAAPPSKSST